MIRLVTHNDWVVYSLLVIGIMYVISAYLINKDISLFDYMKMEEEEASNSGINWIITSCVLIFSLSLLLSQYLPTVPKEFSILQIGSYTINKMGATLLIFSIYYLAKTILTYFFYASSGNLGVWKNFYFYINKYNVVSISLILVFVIVQFFLPINKDEAFNVYFSFLIILILGKILFCLFHKQSILPKQWYYKILYICTLQIIPTLVVWKYLFL